MKKLLLKIALASIFAVIALASVVAAESLKTSSNTAHLLPQKQVDVGLFQPLRYGYSDNVEFSMHPLLFFVMPNFDVTWAHGQRGEFAIASRYGVTYPTPLLRLIAKEGIGGMISPEFDIPHIFSFQNELLATTPVFGKHLFTAKIGVNFALLTKELDSRTTIDLPLIFTRTSVYYNDFGLNLGADMQGPLFKRFDYLVDADIFYHPTADADVNFALEHKGLITWKKSARFRLCLGYLLSYGKYPFGEQWHLLPLFDLQWAWNRN